jgi:NADP-dependent 3-hydroxy acid dehydrogenase YdfG
MSSHTGRVAVVTGAGSGIGRAIAFKLAMDGAVVGMIDKNLSSLEAVCKEAGGFGEMLLPFKADLEKDPDIRGLVTDLNRRFDGMDILVHSAGVISLGDIGTASVDDFDLQYRVNVRAAYILTQALLPLLRARQGQVVFIISSSGIRAKAGAAGYSASKHALKALADALRDEVNREGIRVTCVFPGRTATPMQSEIFKTTGVPYVPEVLLQPEDVAQVVLDALRLNRTAEVTDIHVRPAIKSD